MQINYSCVNISISIIKSKKKCIIHHYIEYVVDEIKSIFTVCENDHVRIVVMNVVNEFGQK